MLSAGYIRQQNQERAEAAAQEGLRPFVYFSPDEVHDRGAFPFPHIGSHRPHDWELVETHFVDSSGLGRPNEPALTGSEFADLIVDRIYDNQADGYVTGWAIVEAGQFQVYVGEFVKSVSAYREERVTA